MVDGRPSTALEVQRTFLEAAECLGGESELTDWTLREWKATLDQLEKDPMAMDDRLDWVAKKKICEQYMSEAGVGWDDDGLHSVDLEYHNIDPAQSLFYGLSPKRITRDLDIMVAQTDPPQDTRAKGRAKLVEMITKRKGSPIYAFDWNFAQIDRQRLVDLSNPFDTYENPYDQWGNFVFESGE